MSEHSSSAHRRHQRILNHARRGLEAFGLDTEAMSDVEVEAACVMLNAWIGQMLGEAKLSRIEAGETLG